MLSAPFIGMRRIDAAMPAYEYVNVCLSCPPVHLWHRSEKVQ